MKKLYFLILLFLFLYFSCEEKQQEDLVPPTVIITSPETGTIVNEIITITCMSSDNRGINRVELWVNGEPSGLQDDSEPYSFHWSTIDLEDGIFKIIVRSYDTSNNITDSNPIVLTVDNTQSNPQAVNIQSILFQNGGVYISWEQSFENDFSAYRLEKSFENTMDSFLVIFNSDILLETIPENLERAKITSFFEENVDPLINQFYRVCVIDTFDFETKGQVFSSAIDPVPVPVDVKSVTYNFTNVVVEWEKSTDGDFSHYKLLYSQNEDGFRDTISTLNERSDTLWIMGIDTSNFYPTHENWFWVITYDSLNQISLGEGKTSVVDSIPTQSELYPILYGNGSFIINWSQNYDQDFKSYTLFESLSENMIDQAQIYTTTDSSRTTFTRNVVEGQYRYYQLLVEDFWGLVSTSNVSIGDSHNWFVKTFSGDGNEVGASVLQENDDGYILIGTTSSFGSGLDDIWLIKTDYQGNQEWSTTFGGDANDRASLIQNTLDGGYIIVGTTSSYGNGSDDIWLVKTNEDGSEEWNKIFGEDGDETGSSVQQTNDGGYIVVGTIFSNNNTSDDVWLIKTDAEGNSIWSDAIGGPENDRGAFVQKTTDNGFIIVGTTSSYGNGSYDAWLIKTDSDGNVQWNKTYGGAGNDQGHSVEQTDDEGYFIVGCFDCESNESNMWLIKTNREGNEQWSQILGGNSYEWGRFGQQTDDGGYIVTGLTTSLGSGSSDAWLIRLNPQGEEIWDKTFGGVNGDGSSFVQETNDGGYILIGYTTSFSNNGSDIWLIKTDSDGNTEPYDN
ncbi:MAG: hypothetical protein CMG62_03215 [Candidatus Marinimicrobia bacterium]|nr:hypothetical protein [Candidatus Neomarinimicrobiota bacterium]